MTPYLRPMKRVLEVVQQVERRGGDERCSTLSLDASGVCRLAGAVGGGTFPTPCTSTDGKTDGGR